MTQAIRTVRIACQGPAGPAGLYPQATWDAGHGLYQRATVLAHSGGVWLALRDTAVEPSAAAPNDWGSWLDFSGLVGGFATLGQDGKIPAAQLPAIAITDTFAAVSQVAMLALTAQKGDIAIRSDLNKSFVLAADDPTVLANWKELLTPTDVVLSVAGLTGAIGSSALKAALSISTADVSGLGGTAALNVGSGLGAAGGNLFANVTSVAGRTGAVTLANTDISGLGFFATGTDAAILTGTLAYARLSGALPATNFPVLTGDVTNTAGSLTTAIGNNKITNAMLNADVFSSAHTWSAAQTFGAAITYGGVTWTNGVTGTGKPVLDNAPSFPNGISVSGLVSTNNGISLNGIYLQNDGANNFRFYNSFAGGLTYFQIPASDVFQFGKTDAASGASAQTIRFQSNTGAGTTGPLASILGANGGASGGTGGDLLLAGGTGGAANGYVRFGTAAANSSVTPAGTIAIKDAAGNMRHLMYTNAP